MKRRLDLLPSDLRRGLLVGRAAKRWSGVAVVALVPLLAVCGAEYRESRIDRAGVEERLRRYRDVLAVQDAIHETHAETEALRTKVAALRVPDGGPGPLEVLGYVGAAAGEHPAGVQIRQLTMSATAAAPATRGGASSAKATAESAAVAVAVAGVGRDDAAVARFVEGLRDTGGFDSVELKSSSAQSGGDGTARLFRIDCVLRRAAG